MLQYENLLEIRGLTQARSMWDYNELFRAGAGLMYACFMLGAVMRSPDDMDAKYAMQLFTEVELMIMVFLSCMSQLRARLLQCASSTVQDPDRS